MAIKNIEAKKARSSIWRRRGTWFATGLNVWASILLAALLMVMINYLAYRYYTRWDVSRRGSYSLSDKTGKLLAGLSGEVDIVSFFPQGHELFDDIRNLLKEYEYAADKSGKLKLNISIVDPVRDLAATMELAQKYGVRSSNVLVFEADGRKKYLEARDISDLSGNRLDGTRGYFRGERAFSSAILSVTQTRSPTVYFLTGHAEHSINDYNNSGYSDLARIMRRDNMKLKSLLLAGLGSVPEDCSVLVIAGPDRRFARAEVDLLSDYLDGNGRLLLLVDPAVNIGLEELLRKWGVKLDADVVVDPSSTRTGRELIVIKYGDHPSTRNLMSIATTFYMPRSVEAVAHKVLPSHVQADKPRVFILASSSEKGWAETDLNRSPARFDAGHDRPGPISVAVAVEKGVVSGIEVEISPTRMVVIGDSDFVSNGGLKEGGGGNEYFFMNAVNWLVEREILIAIAPKIRLELRLDMNRRQKRTAFLIIALAVPAVVAFIGFMVWLRRRR